MAISILIRKYTAGCQKLPDKRSLKVIVRHPTWKLKGLTGVLASTGVIMFSIFSQHLFVSHLTHLEMLVDDFPLVLSVE